MNPVALEAEPNSAVACSGLSDSSFEIHLCAEIAAAQRCLFYALTLPEYLEAWLKMPGTTNLRVTVQNCPDELQLDRYCSLGYLGSIFLRFHMRSEDSICLTWRNCLDVNTSSTSVHVTLRENQGTCTLSVTHTGFATEEESRWHHVAWTRSLVALAGLMSR